MKKILIACLAFVLALSGVCSAEGDIFANQGADSAPQTDIFAQDIFAAPAQSEAVRVVPLNEYVYAEAVSSAINIGLYYPSHWENLPGRYTICFREPVAEGDIPARVAVTCKQLADKPSSDRTQRELANFMTSIVEQYDTYKIGNLTEGVSFIDKKGFSSVYEATLGDKVIRGYVVIVSVGSALYGYHFCCEDKDYSDMTIVMQRTRDSVYYTKQS